MKNKINDFKNLINSFEEMIKNDPDEASAYLLENGFDPDKVATRGEQFARRMIADLKIELKNKTQLSLLDKAKRKIAELQSNLGGDVKYNLAKVLSGEDKLAFQTLFNNFQALKEQDLIDMLSEVQLLDIIEKLEAKDKNNKNAD